MVTHAFFKALLFLGAGSVIHGMHDEQDMRKMGGLRKCMPITAATFIVGWLAIAGILPFAGFWSKDEILAKAWCDHNYALWAVGVVAALITAFYMTRQVWLVFYGPERWRDGRGHRSRVGRATMRRRLARARTARVAVDDDVPLVVLAVSRSSAGSSTCRSSTRARLPRPLARAGFHGAPPIEVSSFGTGFALSTIALVVAVVGIVFGRAVYRNGLNADGDDPTVNASVGFARCSRTAITSTTASRALVSGPGHRVRPLPRRRLRPQGHRRRRQRRRAGFREAGGRLAPSADRLVRNYALGIVPAPWCCSCTPRAGGV